LCSALGRYDESLRFVKRAQELDPLAHSSDVATELLRSGRYAEARDLAAQLVAGDPRWTRGHSNLGWANLFLGNHADGIASMERAAALAPGSTMFLSQLGQAYAMTGRRDEALGVLGKLQALAKERHVSPYHFAYVYTGLGHFDEAMDWLEKAYEDRAGAIYGIKGSFLFKDLRSHPRFRALLAKMNLA